MAPAVQVSEYGAGQLLEDSHIPMTCYLMYFFPILSFQERLNSENYACALQRLVVLAEFLCELTAVRQTLDALHCTGCLRGCQGQ